MGIENSFWKGRRVLVTGGAGFVGYSLSSKLAALGAKVYVLDIKPALPKFELIAGTRKKIVYVRGSILSKPKVQKLLRDAKIQTVFHLAAEAIVDRAFGDTEHVLETNIKGTWTVLECARAAKSVKEIVVASSDKAYGAQAKLPYKEDAALQGLNPYDNSKSCTDLIAQMYGKSYNLPVAVVRCGNIYGPGDTNWSRLVPDACRSAAQNKVLGIRSDGTYKRDFVYVDDAVQAYLVLAQNIVKRGLTGEAFNFGNDEAITVLDMLKEMRDVVPTLQYKILNTAHNEIPEQFLDSSKAHRVLKWRPETSLSDGLKKAYAWYAQTV